MIYKVLSLKISSPKSKREIEGRPTRNIGNEWRCSDQEFVLYVTKNNSLIVE